MTTEVEYSPEQTGVSLVNGIIRDLQDLVEQQLQLSRREIEDSFQRHSSAAAIFALGVGVLFVDAIVISLAMAHLLYWSFSPVGADPASFPLWACYGVVSAVLSMIGAFLIYVGRARFRMIRRHHNSIKENA